MASDNDKPTTRLPPRILGDLQYETVTSELVLAYREDKSLVQFQNLISARQYFRLYGTVARYVNRGDTVLDWGTGNGHLSYFLVQSGYIASAFGFDKMPRIGLNLSDELYAYYQGSVTEPVRLPYEDQSFDAVVSVGVLEHVHETGGNEVESLREIHRLLKPGGVFICYHLPNRYSWIEWSLRRLGKWSHTHRYTHRDITTLTGSASLHLLESGRYAILPRNIWGWVDRQHKLPLSHEIARIYDRLDNVLSGLASPICQNYYFVAQRLERQQTSSTTAV